MAGLLGQTPRQASRMPGETRLCLCAAHLALEAADWRDANARNAGLIVSGYDGCLEADQRYFADYVANGRSNGLASVFVYTLPTSAAAEIAIALKLFGPLLHVNAPRRPAAELIRSAQELVEDGEAPGMLALWSSPREAVCFAVDGAGDDLALPISGAPEWGVADCVEEIETIARLRQR
jgi:3-oxoacyl-(acyl-carrier-protein) synthase